MTESDSDGPLFSVIIPAFNASQSIHVALDSLLRQTCRDFEIIMVDDCSDDVEALQRVLGGKAYRSLRVRLMHSAKRLNGAGARNRGLDLAKGNYVAFLDADDSWTPDKLEVCFNRIRELELAPNRLWIIHSQSLIWKKGKVVKSMPVEALVEGESVAEYLFGPRGWIQTSTIVLRTADARRIYFNAALKRHQDYDFCIRAQHLGYKFDLIPRPLVNYFVGPAGVGAKGETIQYVRWWLKEMGRYLSRRDVVTYRAYELSRRLLSERGTIAASAIFVANFPLTSWRNQVAFLRLVWRKATGANYGDANLSGGPA